MTEARTSPAARLDELTLLYERNAYVVWNVALRTALGDDAAGSAARRAFVAQVASPDERRLALDAARLAVDAVGGVDPRGVEDPVLAATAHLAAVQRAVLALEELTDMRPSAVAAKLGIDADREQQLRDGAYEQLGILLGGPKADARGAYADVPWLEPPAELWQELYPELHATVTQQPQAADVAVPAASARTNGGAERTRVGRRLRRGALAGLAVLAVAGVAWAATSGSGSDADAPTESPLSSGDYLGDATAQGEGAEDGAEESATSLLTPEELDALRREEIEQLKRLERRKANQRLPQQERDRAARKVNELVKLAQARQRAAERRELALRRQLAAEREARLREQNKREQESDERPAPTTEQQPAQEQEDDGRQPTGGQKTGGGSGGDRDPVETECLYDQSSGTYICPE